MTNKLHKILNVIKEAEELKMLLRHSWLSNGRQESVAEHTWRMAFMAMLLEPELEEDINLGKVLQMIIVHDLGEIRAGDFHAFKDIPDNKEELERNGIIAVTKDLDEPVREKILALWEEFEAGETPEAKLTQAMDKLEVLVQHMQADISTWEEREYHYNIIYGFDQVEYSPSLLELRELLKEEAEQKIAEEGE